MTNWFNNGRTERFLQFTVAKSGGNGKSQFAATENHLVRTPGGWVEAGEIIAGDRVMVSETARLSDQQWQIVLGGLMGDGHLAPDGRARHGVRFRMGHGAEQVDYLDYKTELLGNIPHTRSVRSNGAERVDFTPAGGARRGASGVYWGDVEAAPRRGTPQGTHPTGPGVWFMDERCFTVDTV